VYIFFNYSKEGNYTIVSLGVIEVLESIIQLAIKVQDFIWILKDCLITVCSFGI